MVNDLLESIILFYIITIKSFLFCFILVLVRDKRGKYTQSLLRQFDIFNLNFSVERFCLSCATELITCGLFLLYCCFLCISSY